MLLQNYMQRLPVATEMLREFAKYHAPISMAASEQTGTMLWALLDLLEPDWVVETGSGYTTVIFAQWWKECRERFTSAEGESKAAPQLIHVEESVDWKDRVLKHLQRVELQPGTFIDYPELYEMTLDRPFFALLDGLRSARPIVARWLTAYARHGVILIDDAQEGTNPEVLESLAILEQSAQGRMVDLSAWTTDIYGRSAKLFIGAESGMSHVLTRELASAPASIPKYAAPKAVAPLQTTQPIDALPLISIVIPCYNKGKYIAQAIESALAQTYPRIEVIVVNDGSTDNSSFVIQAVAEIYPNRFTVLHQDNLGMSKARDAGVYAASGDYLVMLDGDDYLHPAALQTWHAYAQQHPEHTVIYSKAIRVDEQGRVIGKQTPSDARLKLEGNILSSMLGWGVVTCTSLIEREKVLLTGGYSNELGLKGHDDYFLYLRLLLAGYTFGYVDEFLLFYRDVAGSVSKDTERGNENKYRALQYAYRHYIAQMVTAAQELTLLGMHEHTERVRLQAVLDHLLSNPDTAPATAQIIEQRHGDLPGQDSPLVIENAALRGQIDAMRNTRGWQLLERWWRLKKRLFGSP